MLNCLLPIHVHHTQAIDSKNRYQAKKDIQLRHADERFIVQFSTPTTNYFEATIISCISKPSAFTFGIGLAPVFYSQGMTGWYHGSIGYHSDDGLVFNNHGDARSENVLQQFKVGDTIGCA